ncbi:hypothetical protein [uncultured Senegalimassilia sp.]|uniref:dUTP diphosphatase n=1 Tax=uncultured Senegalimassilia sp. TaxID=1714350 RepID=UPI0026316DEB|nr:hypothetical protein [uncultured Senegalimassilia sp.]
MKEEAIAQKPAPTATIKIDSWWSHPERHGAMFDLAASEDVKLREGEVKVIPLGIRMKLPDGYFGLVVPRSSTCLKYGILMANSVGVIEPDYCGDSDVWGFVAYATRGTKIPKGTRIAQFMPVRMFGDLDFNVVGSMPYTDRGGYGSTGERSNGGEPSFYDRRGRKLTVGCYCRISGTDSCGIVKKLYESEERGHIVLADFSGYGEMRKRCVDVELDDRPRDCDGVPIEVGDVVWVVYEDGSSVYDCSVVVVNTDGANGLVRVRQKQENGWSNFYFPSKLTHREPDSFELLAREMGMDAYDYCEEYGIACGGDDDPAEFSMHADLVRRMKAVAARG